MSAFKNLKSLAIDTRADELDFLKKLPFLEELYIEAWSSDNTVDFLCFSHLEHLKKLCVSGGDISDIKLKNLDGLTALKTLEHLTLHEFGSVDLRPLRSMPWLKRLFCGYANEVFDIDAIASLVNLESLELVSVEMDDLSFLDALPDSIEIVLSALKVKQGIDRGKLSRFLAGDFDCIDSLY